MIMKIDSKFKELLISMTWEGKMHITNKEVSENLVKELESHLETDKSDESLSEVINKWDQIKESTKLKIIKMLSREFGNKHPEE